MQNTQKEACIWVPIERGGELGLSGDHMNPVKTQWLLGEESS